MEQLSKLIYKAPWPRVLSLTGPPSCSQSFTAVFAITSPELQLPRVCDAGGGVGEQDLRTSGTGLASFDPSLRILFYASAAPRVGTSGASTRDGGLDGVRVGALGAANSAAQGDARGAKGTEGP